jgi:hypothetical protein
MHDQVWLNVFLTSSKSIKSVNISLALNIGKINREFAIGVIKIHGFNLVD